MSTPAGKKRPGTPEGVVETIREGGGRATVARRVIAEALAASEGHLTAEQLAQEVHSAHPEIAQSTVYRSLEAFEQLGLAYHTHLGHGAAQWHLTVDDHMHLTCESCGAIIEAPPALMSQFVVDIEEVLGFRVDIRHFALTGLCSHCRG